MSILQNKRVEVIYLGEDDYQKVWDYQESIFKKTVDRKIDNRKSVESSVVPTDNYLIFCEHPHVYTLGKSGSIDNLLLDEDGLRENFAQFYKINRGGDITYHGPGQIVAYPILDLENFFTDIHKYLRFLEEAVISTMADFGLKAGRIDGLTGVWIDFEEGAEDPRKICAMGVKSSRWVTMHGLALNVNTDLSYFGHIVPCGIDDKAVTSMQKELGHEVNMDEVRARLTHHLATIFEMELI
ncbi:lipoyl(octanoyl) transferase LipB [Roseivirga sp.]|jgi:lipoyl(octanoyl) transferase|uniref:lipoyl(octanoyl) transferase LipB n=1 Tax=Roseivirga sp. TaxID=1964215 RepID=UPI000D7B84D0|nr:lipoyl(octanoyl) transferase LipB [Roseivirga sp.]MBO6493982.1 lipoyl(octanoyl) transferase LipB [Roseivirga sp.]MBO6661525.1 lipoyl(octanoyl) transferase LipB [Roseivirga sp.]MBO6908491.1 lipoyl(octanoyl) transferase LipB [Roseivirga sp.]PWL29903.1 MAG: lipoyl(octanoyl) transferase [Roseivirga sp. XM-24bin3]